MKKMAVRINYREIPPCERGALSVVAVVHDQLITGKMSVPDARAAYKKILTYAHHHGFERRGDPRPALGEIVSFATGLAELRRCIEKWETWEEPEEEQAAVPTDADIREAWGAIVMTDWRRIKVSL